MPVIHDDVGAFSGEWHHKITQEAIHGVFTSEFCCVRYVMECEVEKRSRALALL
jgi:hypothetical protein